MFEYDNIIDFLSTQIDIIFLTKIRKDSLRLTYSLKLFFIYNVILYLKNIDISSIDASEKLTTMMGCKTPSKIYLYRSKLRKLGYFVEDKSAYGGYTIHPLFRFNNSVEALLSPKTYYFTIQCIEQDLNKY